MQSLYSFSLSFILEMHCKFGNLAVDEISATTSSLGFEIWHNFLFFISSTATPIINIFID